MSKRKDGLVCTAKAKSTQEQCGNPPVVGTAVCRIHGGSAPQVKEAGVRRMMKDLLGPAMVEIGRIIREPDVADNVKFSAIKDLLDRTGYKPVTQIELIPSEEQVQGWIDSFDDT